MSDTQVCQEMGARQLGWGVLMGGGLEVAKEGEDGGELRWGEGGKKEEVLFVFGEGGFGKVGGAEEEGCVDEGAFMVKEAGSEMGEGGDLVLVKELDYFF